MGFLDKVGDVASNVLTLGGASKAKAAGKARERAAESALQTNLAELEKARGRIWAGTNRAADQLQGGADQAAGAITGGFGAADKLYREGVGGARRDMATLLGLQSYGDAATQSVTGEGSRLAQLAGRLDQPTDLQADPGFQFRQQQGEQAINRAAAAQGGRLGGRTLKALAGFNSDLASQEYAAANQRRLADNAQQLQLGGQMLQGDLAAQQNQQRLAELGYGAQGQIAQLSAQEGAALAGMQTQQASGLANLYNNLGSNLANNTQNYVQGQTHLTGVGINAQNARAGVAGAALAQEANARNAAGASIMGAAAGGLGAGLGGAAGAAMFG